MGKCVNKVQLLGHLGQAAEIRSTQGGMTVATFSIATSYPVKDGRGGWQEKTEWTRCVAFARRAEVLRDYTGKGSRIYVEGHLQTRSWDDKETGQKRYATEVILDDLTLLDGKGRGAGGDQREPGDDRDAHMTDEDIPF